MLKKVLIVGCAVTAGLFVIVYLLLSESRGNQSNQRTQLVVSAAVSLQRSMEIIEQEYESKHGEIDLIFNYGSSGALQQQIEQGAPVDVFLSAGHIQMERLKSLQLIELSQNMMRNNLVVIINSESTLKWTGLTSLNTDDIRHFAIGQPESVPAGSYAQQALKFLGVWDQIEDKLIYAKDVRQVLSTVETGNVEVGFVYMTDAIGSTKVKVVEQLSENTHQPILYPVGVMNTSKNPEEAHAFYQYLLSEQALSVVTALGFEQP